MGGFRNCGEVEEGWERVRGVGFGVGGFLGEEEEVGPGQVRAGLTDPTGKNLLIELTASGALTLTENKVKMSSDNANHAWNVTNIGRYLHLSPFTIYKYETFGDVSMLPYGHGTGMMGMPGDFCPESRFVKAAYFRLWSLPLPDVHAATNLL